MASLEEKFGGVQKGMFYVGVILLILWGAAKMLGMG